MFKLNKALVLKQLAQLIIEVVYRVDELNDGNHKIVSFYYDTEDEVLDVSTYSIDSGDFTRSLMGKFKPATLHSQKVINYITINKDKQGIRDELLENIEIIEQLLLK